MPSFAGISRCVSALVGLTLAGCYTPYRYNPYVGGVPMYGGAPVAPLQPQLGPPTGVPTPVDPNNPNAFPPANGAGGSQYNGGSQLAPTPDPNNSLPPSNNSFPPSNNNSFDPSLPPPTGGQGGTGNGYVPNYTDPNSLPPTNGSGTFEGGGTTPFGQDGASFQPDAEKSVSQVRYERTPQGQELQLTAHQSSPAETWPVAAAAAETIAPPPAAEPVPQKKPNPYGYDAVGYRWLRGVVDFDEKQHAWVLIYNPTPAANDAYQGQVTLIDNGLLQNMQNNDVVLVEGQLDPATPEPGTGKPQYRVKRMHGPLVPKS